MTPERLIGPRKSPAKIIAAAVAAPSKPFELPGPIEDFLKATVMPTIRNHWKLYGVLFAVQYALGLRAASKFGLLQRKLGIFASDAAGYHSKLGYFLTLSGYWLVFSKMYMLWKDVPRRPISPWVLEDVVRRHFLSFGVGLTIQLYSATYPEEYTERMETVNGYAEFIVGYLVANLLGKVTPEKLQAERRWLELTAPLFSSEGLSNAAKAHGVVGLFLTIYAWGLVGGKVWLDAETERKLAAIRARALA